MVFHNKVLWYSYSLSDLFHKSAIDLKAFLLCGEQRCRGFKERTPSWQIFLHSTRNMHAEIYTRVYSGQRHDVPVSRDEVTRIFANATNIHPNHDKGIVVMNMVTTLDHSDTRRTSVFAIHDVRLSHAKILF